MSACCAHPHTTRVRGDGCSRRPALCCSSSRAPRPWPSQLALHQHRSCVAAAAAADDGGSGQAPRQSDGSGGVRLPPPPDLGGAAPQQRWNAVSLAYLGDAVWEAYLRSHCHDASAPRLAATRVATMVNTQAQAAACSLLAGSGWLAEGEAALLRWAQNSSSVSPPAHASRQQYKQATALEALVAHLYLTDPPRLQQLMAWLLQPGRAEVWAGPMPVAAQPLVRATGGGPRRRGGGGGGSSRGGRGGPQRRRGGTGSSAGGSSGSSAGSSSAEEG